MTSSNGNIFRVTSPLCGEFTSPGEFPTQRPVTRSFDVFFDLRLNKPLSKQSWGWWFETSSRSLWRQRNDFTKITYIPASYRYCDRFNGHVLCDVIPRWRHKPVAAHPGHFVTFCGIKSCKGNGGPWREHLHLNLHDKRTNISELYHQADGRLIVRSREVLKPRDSGLDFSILAEIWQAARQ